MPDPSSNHFDVFLSYHWRDHAQVEALGRRLREQGLQVFLDRWYLAPGQSWLEALESTLAHCRAVAFCLGPGDMGPWQQREQYLALQRQVTAEKQGQTFPVIPVLLPGAEPPLGFLSQQTWVDLRTRPDDPVLLTILSKAVHGEPPGPEVQVAVQETRSTICPYRGLLYFREEDAPFFFGRAKDITQLAQKINQHKLVAVVGASGSGKSSVVRAGLVPVLRHSREQVWEVVTMMPTDRPVRALAAGLMPFLEPDMTETKRLQEINSMAEAMLPEDSKRPSIKLRDVVERILDKQPGTDRLLLIVDQWEELYTLCQDARARRTFMDQVLEATETGKLHVVLTLRGDFFGRAITAYRPLSDRVQEAQVLIGPMTREELRLAIEEPAKLMGLAFETGLVDLLLEQAGDEPGHLPLLEFVLRQLWEQRRGGLMHHEAYRGMGQLEGAIAKKAQALYEKASPEDQRRIQYIFLRLVRPGEGEADTRRRATFAELGEGLQPLVKTLADERLLVTSQVTGSAEETVEVSHEALIRQWGQLKEWVDGDRQFLAWQQRLGLSIKEWDQSHRSVDLLLRGRPLVEAGEWLKNKPDAFSQEEQEYVRASQHRKTKARVLTTLGSLLVVLMIGGPLAWLGNAGVTVPYAWSIVQARLHLVEIREPDMVPIPGGEFQLGAVEGLGGEDEKPVQTVRVEAFQLSQHEVTFDAYDQFVELTGGRSPSDENWGRGRRPVINVSWEEAKGYIAWLSQATGKSYRLPTEAEWEYAARSGSKQETWAGTSAESELEKYAIYKANQTAEVGSKQPNAFGLYDLSGNVYEWVEDCWHENYKDAPDNGAPWLKAGGGYCGQRVIRGGSWLNLPVYLRSSFRLRYSTGFRNNDIGFRLAQDIR
ncbi:MAG: SUMF1/EgtB/PvdO family nonheme iron enzyme [Nitrospirota bacterium]|nr:SUMF1/EgtB/PvdO family nonheme iron enzyme [Nitrospirota bacterium]